MGILGKLFGSQDRVKIMRLFILNPEMIFESKEILRRSKVTARSLNREIRVLKLVKFIKQKSGFVEKVVRGKPKNIRIRGWCVNGSFPFLATLEKLLFSADLYKDDAIVRRLRVSGQLKFVALAGIFLGEDDSRADLLVVGDYIKRSSLEKIIKVMESEIGRELNYGVFDTEDFRYRISIYDKFVRDILDYPHRKILNKLPEFQDFQ